LKPLAKSIFLLALLEIILLVAGIIIVSSFDVSLVYDDIVAASAVFVLINILILVVFFRGQNREPASQTMHSLVAISIKFLAELIFVFIWFFISKKTGLSSVILFFVLYLTFTLFSVLIMLKTLRGKSLE
jgi:hypothetical protein